MISICKKQRINVNLWLLVDGDQKMPLNEVEGFVSRLNEALELRGMSKAELARRIGENPQLLNKWFNAGITKIPGAAYLLKVCKALDIRLVWLVTGEGFMQEITGRGFTEVVTVPEFEVHFQYGEDSPSYTEVTEKVPATYSREFFLEKKIDPGSCRCILAPDNGMAPVIYEGDRVLVDCRIDRLEFIDNGSIYAISYGRQLMLRRLIKQFDSLIVKAENTDYLPERFDKNRWKEVNIIGKVIERSGTV